MATENQLQEFSAKIKNYKKRYLRKEFTQENESATRIMVNSFLADLLGYKELEEIKTEFRIRHEYADYVIQLKRKKHFVVEVKSIQIDLNERHLTQSLGYAANEGIDWILLMNGRQVQLYRVNFAKPVTTTLIYQLDLMDPDDMKKAPQRLWFLTKKAVERGELVDFWKRSSALQLENMARMVYSEDIVKRLRNDLKNDTGIYFQMEDVTKALFELITKSVEIRPRLRKN